ncbi:hypothetical protein CTI14_24270 [Methylobacterium radiotolerans]|nr:hypothetical protein CTI14_24270 [Methylobacterium radiotolerans]
MKNLDYDPETTLPNIILDENSKTLVIAGAVALHLRHSIHALRLEVSFWPDASDRLGFSRLIVQEDKIVNMGDG